MTDWTNIAKLPLWVWTAAVSWGALIGYLTLEILHETNLSEWLVVLCVGGSFCLDVFCALYLAYLILR